jgi:hypothetical protein
MKTNLVKTICYAVAIAMGVAMIVTSLINPLSTTNYASLAGVGLAALGLAGLQNA